MNPATLVELQKWADRGSGEEHKWVSQLIKAYIEKCEELADFICKALEAAKQADESLKNADNVLRQTKRDLEELHVKLSVIPMPN